MHSRLAQTCTSICFNSRLNDDRRMSSEELTVSSQFRKYDIVIFGASGAVGECVVQELALTLSKLASKVENCQSIAEESDQDSGHYASINHCSSGDESPRKNFQSIQSAVKWAVAGRSAVRINETLTRAQLATGIPDLAKSVPILLADLEQHESLLAVCSQTRLIINCTGPSSAYGELFLKACIERHTHYVDVANETSFLEHAQLAYDERARNANVILVPGCGFATMAPELGLAYVHQQVDRDAHLSGVDIILALACHQQYGGNVISHHLQPTTFRWYNCLVSRTFWLSVISEHETTTHAPDTSFHLIRRKLNNHLVSTNSSPMSIKRSTNRQAAKRNQLLTAQSTTNWMSRFAQAGLFVCSTRHSLLGDADTSCMRRSDLVRCARSKPPRAPVKTRTYMSLDTFANGIMAAMFAIIMWTLMRFRLGRYLLRSLPHLTSMGLVSRDGDRASRKRLGQIEFVQTYMARGWPDDRAPSPDGYDEDDEDDSEDNNALLNLDKIHQRREREILVAQCSGPEPMYLASATFVTQAALTIMDELVGNVKQTTCGVLTPGIAFTRTSIFDRLAARRIQFRTIKQYL